jgi:hypothetical protein
MRVTICGDDCGWSKPRETGEACLYDSVSMMVSMVIRHGKRISPGTRALIRYL